MNLFYNIDDFINYIFVFIFNIFVVLKHFCTMDDRIWGWSGRQRRHSE